MEAIVLFNNYLEPTSTDKQSNFLIKKIKGWAYKTRACTNSQSVNYKSLITADHSHHFKY